MKYAVYILAIFLFALGGTANAQEKEKKKYDLSENTEAPDYLVEKDTVEVIKRKKKKRKKKTFNKLKTKRAFTKRGLVIENFYFLKKHKEPDPFVAEIFLYDRTKLKIIKVKRPKYNLEKYPEQLFKIIHGPYKRRKGKLILEEGYFYVGTKHDNWFKYKGEAMIVRERKSYHKGWPGTYRITHYDMVTQKQIKEINPYNDYEENTGRYYYFFENGKVKFYGKLLDGKRVGRWTEYYNNEKHRKKQLLRYPDTAENNNEKPEVLGEWNEKGSMTGGTELKKEKERRKKTLKI